MPFMNFFFAILSVVVLKQVWTERGTGQWFWLGSLKSTQLPIAHLYPAYRITNTSTPPPPPPSAWCPLWWLSLSDLDSLSPVAHMSNTFQAFHQPINGRICPFGYLVARRNCYWYSILKVVDQIRPCVHAFKVVDGFTHLNGVGWNRFWRFTTMSYAWLTSHAAVPHAVCVVLRHAAVQDGGCPLLFLRTVGCSPPWSSWGFSPLLVLKK